MIAESGPQDPIAARATAPGMGAVGMVRVSGEECHQLLLPFLRFAAQSIRNLSDVRLHERKMLRFHFQDPQTGELIDDGLCVFFQGPSSYTGEDSAELFLHGSCYILERALELLYGGGFRPAQPGEFTQRAYLGGKIDLTMAEGIRQLSCARSQQEWQAARFLAAGGLAEHIEVLRRALIQVRARVEAAMDFPEEQDTAGIKTDDLKHDVIEIRQSLISLGSTFHSGQVASRGLQVLLCGEPNAGKSTLMNALTGTQRAIVTSEAGTTRDFIELPYLLEGRLIHLYDSAGLRMAHEDLPTAELIAIEKTLELITRVHLILLVVPQTAQKPPALATFFQSFKRTMPHSLPAVVRVISQADRGEIPPWRREDDVVSACPNAPQPLKLDDLKHLLIRRTDRALEPIHSGGFITTARHKAAVELSIKALDDWLESHHQGAYEEILAWQLQQASAALGSIIGEVDSEEILDEIFRSFCLGK